MKFFTSPLLVAALVPLASAFPSRMMEAAANDPVLRERAKEFEKLLEKRQGSASSATVLFEPVAIFDADAQYINVSKGSGHEYVPPGSGDLRGPCPGLNAFANHNFLPHNGYATVGQYIEATNKVVGMGPLLGIFLSALGGALDGDILNWSMGGTPSLAQAGATGILGNGLIGSHNKYESDASPTRGDLYDPNSGGDNYKTVDSQFEAMLRFSPNDDINLDTLAAFRSSRFDTQKANNPYFFNGPFTGVLVQPAAYTFIYRFMANHSADYPAGKLSHAVAASWFGMTHNSDNSYTANQGGEKIPDNWYKRPIAYPYDVAYFLADTLNAAALYPKFLDIGGNTGTPNSFTGVDIEDLTGGVFKSATLLQGNNLACYVYQLSAQAKPDIILGPLNALTNAIGNIVGKLGCPQLAAIDEKLLEKFPGYTKKPVYGE